MEVTSSQILSNSLPPLPPFWKRLTIKFDFPPGKSPNNFDELLKQFITNLQEEGITATITNNPLTITLLR